MDRLQQGLMSADVVAAKPLGIVRAALKISLAAAIIVNLLACAGSSSDGASASTAETTEQAAASTLLFDAFVPGVSFTPPVPLTQQERAAFVSFANSELFAHFIKQPSTVAGSQAFVSWPYFASLGLARSASDGTTLDQIKTVEQDLPANFPWDSALALFGMNDADLPYNPGQTVLWQAGAEFDATFLAEFNALSWPQYQSVDFPSQQASDEPLLEHTMLLQEDLPDMLRANQNYWGNQTGLSRLQWIQLNPVQYTLSFAREYETSAKAAYLQVDEQQFIEVPAIRIAGSIDMYSSEKIRAWLIGMDDKGTRLLFLQPPSGQRDWPADVDANLLEEILQNLRKEQSSFLLPQFEQLSVNSGNWLADSGIDLVYSEDYANLNRMRAGGGFYLKALDYLSYFKLDTAGLHVIGLSGHQVRYSENNLHFNPNGSGSSYSSFTIGTRAIPPDRCADTATLQPGMVLLLGPSSDTDTNDAGLLYATFSFDHLAGERVTNNCEQDAGA